MHRQFTKPVYLWKCKIWEFFKRQHRLLPGFTIELTPQYSRRRYRGTAHSVPDKQNHVLCDVGILLNVKSAADSVFRGLGPKPRLCGRNGGKC